MRPIILAARILLALSLAPPAADEAPATIAVRWDGPGAVVVEWSGPAGSTLLWRKVGWGQEQRWATSPLRLPAGPPPYDVLDGPDVGDELEVLGLGGEVLARATVPPRPRPEWRVWMPGVTA